MLILLSNKKMNGGNNMKYNEDKILKVEINNISIIRDFNTKSDFNSDF